MTASAAAETCIEESAAIGDREPAGSTATVSIILDGENAWEFYAENGRDFLRQCLPAVQDDAEIRTLTMSEAADARRMRRSSREFFLLRGSREFRRVDRTLRRCARLGSAAGCA